MIFLSEKELTINFRATYNTKHIDFGAVPYVLQNRGAAHFPILSYFVCSLFLRRKKNAHH